MKKSRSDIEKYISPTRWCRHRFVQEIISHIDTDSTAKVCEIGCGNGEFIAHLAIKGFSCIGLDISSTAVNVAKKSNLNNNNIIINGELDCIKSKFDLVFSFNVLEHINDDATFLTNIIDMLNPGGLLILTFPAQSSLYNFMDEFYGHYRRYDFDNVQSLFAMLPVKIVHYWTYGYILVQRLGSFLMRSKVRKTGNRSKSELTKMSGMVRTPFLWKILYPIFRIFYPWIYYFQFNDRESKKYANALIVIKKNRKISE
jgi:SAM-dependent methyltransferase